MEKKITWQTNGCNGIPEYDGHSDDYDGPRANVIKYMGEAPWSWTVYRSGETLAAGTAPTAGKARKAAERYM